MRREWYAGCPIEGSLGAEERRGLKRFEMLCRNFARLERVVAGEVQFELPAATSSLASALKGRAVGQGEELAKIERKRLRLGEDPLDDMVSILEEMGIKIVGVQMPEGSIVAGGFFFSSDVGPCVMVNSSMPADEQMVSAAHQYCHFLADYNPYLPRLCTCGAPAGEDPVEERAAGFAGAFLLSAGSLKQLLAGKGGMGTDADALEALSIYYGVPVWAVAYRLRGLGLEVEPVAYDGRASRPGPDEEASADLPRRLVQLAMEARARGLVSPLRMARLLQMRPPNAEKLYSYFKNGVENLGEAEASGD